jgi:RNA polymerase sigma factor (sigma-70 family)
MRDTGTSKAEDIDEAVALVRRARDGELAAFNALVLRYQDSAYSLALRFLGSPPAAEDATQEAFLRAFRNIGRLRDDRFRPWLLTIVANAARDELRRQQRRPQRSLEAARTDDDMPALDPPEPGPTPEGVALQTELRGELERALRELPDDWRLVVVLSDIHGLSYEEVAAAAGVPVGTVKSRLSRARGRLRDLLRTTREHSDPPQRLNTQG